MTAFEETQHKYIMNIFEVNDILKYAPNMRRNNGTSRVYAS